jgi:hypothetical protein
LPFLLANGLGKRILSAKRTSDPGTEEGRFAARSGTDEARIAVAVAEIRNGTFLPRTGVRDARVGPEVGRDLCPYRHLGLILSGSETILFPDGDEVVLQPGDIYFVEAGHDSWISSEEPCVSLDLPLPQQ